jgi:hypothetical protein
MIYFYDLKPDAKWDPHNWISADYFVTNDKKSGWWISPMQNLMWYDLKIGLGAKMHLYDVKLSRYINQKFLKLIFEAKRYNN